MLPNNILGEFNEYFNQELEMFFTALHINEWKTDNQSLKVGEWRTEWKHFINKNL